MCQLNLKHGGRLTRLRVIWYNMIRRCHVPHDTAFKFYGEKGIKVIEVWRNSFEAFYDDMGTPPSDKHELDRKDNMRDYCKENCRWVTRSEQMLNTRASNRVAAFGETLTVSQWSDRFGVDRATIRHRLLTGVEPETAVTAPAWKGTRGKPEPNLIAIGGASHTLQGWADVTGIAYGTLRSRLVSGLSPEDAITKPRHGPHLARNNPW